MIMYLYIWACVLIAVLWLYIRTTYSYFKKHEINHFPPLPLIGNMDNLFFRKEHSVHTMSKLYLAFPEDRFVGIYEFVNKNVFIFDTELIKQIGVKDFDCFSERRGLGDNENSLLGKSLFGLKGQKWREMRSTLSPAFTGSKLRGMVALIQDCSKNLVSYLNDEIKKCKYGHLDVDTRDLLSRYTNDVIATCAFGLNVNSIADRENIFYKMGEKLTTFNLAVFMKIAVNVTVPVLNQIFAWDIFPKDATDFLRSLVLKTMKNRDETNGFRPDLIQILLEAKKGILKHETMKEEKDAGFATVEESDIGKNAIKQGWDDEILFAQAALFFFAGFDTVSTAMVFLLYELALNPEIQNKLRQEIDDCYERYEGKVEYDKINQMKYLDMVVSESLRKWPPVSILDRVCQKSYNIGKPHSKASKDYYLEKGSVIGIPIWPIHYDPKYYPEPQRFDPERFSDDNKHNIKPFTYLPFGVGPRNCIGSRFALTEIKTMVFDLLRHFEVSPTTKTRIPVELDPFKGFMRMKGGHWLRVAPRDKM